jgi:hypothetical protein
MRRMARCMFLSYAYISWVNHAVLAPDATLAA